MRAGVVVVAIAGAAIAFIAWMAAWMVPGRGDGRRPDVAGYGAASPAYFLRYAADPTTDPERERHDAVTYSDSPSKPVVDDMVRSCRAARTFPVYALGERFAKLALSDATVTCQVPDPPVEGGEVRVGSQAAADLFYGPCEESGRGCAPTLHVRSRPARAEPHSRYHRPDYQVPHRHLTIGGRRAMITTGEGAGDTIEVYFPRTTVTVQGPPRVVREAAEHLAPARVGPRP